MDGITWRMHDLLARQGFSKTDDGDGIMAPVKWSKPLENDSAGRKVIAEYNTVTGRFLVRIREEGSADDIVIGPWALLGDASLQWLTDIAGAVIVTSKQKERE